MNGETAVGGGEGGAGGDFTSIPTELRKTIQNIREITGKQHSDDDIYNMLTECSLDPDETAQKLLYLDTFHEVKSRRDRKKEGNKKSDVAWAGQDCIGGRNLAGRRESHIRRGGSVSSILRVEQKSRSNPASTETKASSIISNGPRSMSNGNSRHGPSSRSSLSVGINEPNGSSAADVSKVATPPKYVAVAGFPPTGSAIGVKQVKSTLDPDQLSPSAAPATESGASSPVLEPVLTPAIAQQTGAVVGKAKEVGIQRSAAEAVEKNKVSEPLQPSSSVSDDSLANSSSSDSVIQSAQEPDVSKEVITSEVVTTKVEGISHSPAELNVNVRPRVTFSNHFQFPGALKNGLIFGSIECNFGLSTKLVGGIGGDNNSLCSVKSSEGTHETAKEPSSNQSVLPNAQVHLPDHEESLSPPELEKEDTPEGNVSSDSDLKNDQLKQEILSHPESLNPAVQNASNYDLGLMSAMLRSQLGHFEVSESQVQETSRLTNLSESSPALSSRSPTPPIQSSMPPQPVPVLRQPYPPNFIPYGHYYHHPFYMPPMPQYLSHNGFPQQPPSSNVYLPPAAAAGVKSPLPQLKPGANAGNPNHIGLPFGGSFATSPAGYAPSSAVTSGSSSAIKDLASQLKENHVYPTRQLSEVSAVWIPGQDMSSLPVNSLYNIPSQGQHMPFSAAQPAHGTFNGIYAAGQTLAAPTTLMQQSQAMAGPIEAGTPSSGVFQQPQHAQMNWISNF